jgi:hypothetical protein
MTHEALHAVLDTMLPGDEGEPPLPPASQAGLDLAKLARLAEPVIAALGNPDGFLAAAPAERVARLRIVELNVPAAFKALLAETLQATTRRRRCSRRSAGASLRRSPMGTTSHRTTMRCSACWRRSRAAASSGVPDAQSSWG